VTETAEVRRVRLNPRDILHLGLLGIRSRRLRAVLSALGISIGITTLVVVTGIPASSRAALSEQLTSLGSNMLRADPLAQSDEPVLLPLGSLGMVERIGPVTHAAVVANTHATVRRSDRVDPNSTSGVTVLASRGDVLGTVNGRVSVGRFLTAATDAFPMVVLGYEASRRLGINAVGTGASRLRVYIDGSYFTVIGILAPMPLAADLDSAVFVGWEVARSALGFDGRPTVVYAKAREDALEDVRAALSATLSPRASGLVQVSRPSEVLAAKNATESTFAALFVALAAVSLLVGGVGVANTMFISVLERRREIGLRRALGATRGQIRAQFLTEAIALSGLGGVAGSVIGVLATLAYATYERWPVVIAPATLAAGLGGAVVIGALAGISPSMRAARLTPTEALATA